MNLVEISVLVKRIIAIIVAIFVMFIVFLILKPVVRSAIDIINPPKDLPNPIYGQLDPLEFVEKPITNSKPKYSLNTRDGKLPALQDKMSVLQFAAPTFNYSAGKDAQLHASILGFTEDELISDLKGNVYRWRDSDSGGILEINTSTEEINLRTSLSGKERYFPAGVISESSAISAAKSMFEKIDRLTNELYKEGTQTSALGRLRGNQVTETKQAYEAQLARVDFFRDLAGFPILGPDPKKGLINVTLRQPQNTDHAFNYPQIEYHQWEPILPTRENLAIYPIIPVSDAWKAVGEQNKGVIVNVTPKGSDIFANHIPTRVDHILINNIYLAYYDTPNRQNHIQPIYVFEGSYNVANKPGGDITMYFPAVDGKWIKPVSTDK